MAMSLGRRISRGAIVALCGAGLALGGSTGAAFAQTTPINAGMTSLINPATPASLNIHKLLGDPTGPGTGKEATVPGTGMAAEFQVFKIKNLDSGNIADWGKYSNLDANNIPAGDLDAPITVTTGADGNATQALAQGFYLIKEVPVSDDDIEGNEASGRTTIAPFLAALPMFDAAANGWNYNVHVYPKNQELGVEKTVVDAGKNVGETISHTISGAVPPPSLDKTKMLNYYQLVDRFTTAELAPDLNTVTVAIVGGSADVNLVKDTDYTVTAVTQDTTDTTKSWFSIQLTKTGLHKLTEAREGNPAVKVQLKVDSKVVAVADGDATNEAALVGPTASHIAREDGTDVPDVPTDIDTETPPPSTNVTSKFGKIAITKSNGKDASAAKLEGAEFELYRCNPGSTDLMSNDKVKVNDQDHWTTGTDGKVTIDGVALEDYANGAKVEKDTFDYCLIETKAPAGFMLNPKPVNVSVTEASPNAYTVAADVLNYPDDGGFRLPETGAAGVLGLIMAGGLVAGGAAMNRGRKDQKEAELLG